MSVCLLAVLLLCVVSAATAAPAGHPEDLPPPEKAMSGMVDPWGLPFSDSLRRFEGRFAASPGSRFAAGLTHSLVKVWPNKYWFRGQSAPSSPADAPPLRAPLQWAAAGETESFQVGVLPRMGAADATYRLEVETRGGQGVSTQVFRQHFVRTAEPGYPRFPVERWPDPLTPENHVDVTGTDCGVFWVDVRIPASHPAGTVEVHATVSDGVERVRLVVPIRVVAGLELDAMEFPLVAWFQPRYGSRTLGLEQMRGLYALVLEHYLQPLDALRGRFRPGDTAEFDEMHRFLAQRGQRLFQVDPPPAEGPYPLYEHVRQAGWVDRALIYSNQDEPLPDVFAKENVPFCRNVRRKYPGLRVFLASQYQDRMADGCDIWMTDLSTEGYDLEKHRRLRQPVLWHYYCHLPIHVQFRAPLTLAPNMEVDCEALQHRLALWMSRYYGAKGVFIWAGFMASGLSDDFWTTLQLETRPADYPYAGIHNGNNFLVYPPQVEGGPVFPSLRLKVLRDGMEDLALIWCAEKRLAEGRVSGTRARRLRALLNPVPGLFVHPQYWDRLPETLLARREAILKALAE